MSGWEKLTAEERNLLIHTKVMGQQLEPCRDGQLDPYMGSYWGCTCGWVSTFRLGSGHSRAHYKSVPRYSESIDAAWNVVRAMNRPDESGSYQLFARFITELEKIIGSNLLFDIVYCDRYGDHLTPERICLAALRAIEPTA